MTSLKVRFAPSPTGHLHVGNLRTALVNFMYAKKSGGHFMLRIDDTDTQRSTTEYERAIRTDLQWLGIKFDSEDRQSERLDRYQQALNNLLENGRAYPCYETQEELGLKRKAQLMSGKPPVYDRSALRLTDAQKKAFEEQNINPHYRFLLQDTEVKWTDLVRGESSIHMSSLSDPVLIRADGRVIYTLASVVDDIDHGITTILRGEDHVTNSAAQIQLFEALGTSAPEMGHMALLAGADGQGLSKRLGSLSISQLREEGFEPLAIIALLSRIGTSDPIEAFGQLSEIVEQFSLEKFGRSTAKFDTVELRIVNSKTLQLLEFEDVRDRIKQFGLSKIDAEFWNAVRGNISYFQDINFWWQLCHSELKPVIEDAEICKIAIETLAQGELTAEIWPSWIAAISYKSGKKGKALFRPLRLALTARTEGPEIKNLLKYMGRERIQKRLSGITA